MINIILIGCLGRMGRTLSSYIRDIDDCSVIAGIDKRNESNTNVEDYHVYKNIYDIDQDGIVPDVLIDFSHPSCLEDILSYGLTKRIPLVIATTGMSEKDIEKINVASEKIPIFFAPNMSLGVNVLLEVCKYIIRATGNKFDVEIIEKHHKDKVDAPSGTANLISEVIKEQIQKISGTQVNMIYDRHNLLQPRESTDIGIHTIRGGDIVGEHEVIFAGCGELIQVSHKATSKAIFAQGAMSAMRFIIKQKSGIYNMQMLINSLQ